MNSQRSVYVPLVSEHQGYFGGMIVLEWHCPKCGGPRGEVFKTRSYDGSRILDCDGWVNPCGHIDKYADMVAEANITA